MPRKYVDSEYLKYSSMIRTAINGLWENEISEMSIQDMVNDALEDLEEDDGEEN